MKTRTIQARHGNPDVPAVMLTLAGVVIVAIGAFFIVLRPPLLPEDLRYLHTTTQIYAAAPGLAPWLRFVFRVAGGFMAASGLLTICVATTIFRNGANGVTIVVAVAGFVSIGLMSAVNFAIDSDFKWALLTVAVLWLLAVVGRMWSSAFQTPK